MAFCCGDTVEDEPAEGFCRGEGSPMKAAGGTPEGYNLVRVSKTACLSTSTAIFFVPRSHAVLLKSMPGCSVAYLALASDMAWVICWFTAGPKSCNSLAESSETTCNGVDPPGGACGTVFGE